MFESVTQFVKAIPNPDNVPGAVTTGYQRQNDQIFATWTGVDTTAPYEANGDIIIPAGGIFDWMGALYIVKEEIRQEKIYPDKQTFLAFGMRSGEFIIEQINTPGSFLTSLNGYYYYTSRVLNWTSRGTPDILGGLSVPVESASHVRKGWLRAILKGGGGCGATNINGNINYKGGEGGYIHRLIYIPQGGTLKVNIGRGGRSLENIPGFLEPGEDTVLSVDGKPYLIAYGGGVGSAVEASYSKAGGNSVNDIFGGGSPGGTGVPSAGTAGTAEVYQF